MFMTLFDVNSVLNSVDPDENYFENGESVSSAQCNYFSFQEYNDLQKNSKNSISIICYNVRSLNANKDSFFAMLNSLESYPEILILTETWYTNDSIIEINGFVGFHTLRGNQRRSGGVSIYIDKRINPKFLPNFSFSNLSIEICSVKFKIGSEMWYLFGVYRPHSGTNDELIEHLN